MAAALAGSAARSAERAQRLLQQLGLLRKKRQHAAVAFVFEPHLDLGPPQLHQVLGQVREARVLRRFGAIGGKRADDGLADAFELQVEARQRAGDARHRIVVAAAHALHAHERLLDLVPARALLGRQATAQLGELEQVLLGAGGQRLRLARVVVVDQPLELVRRSWPTTTFSASLFMLR